MKLIIVESPTKARTISNFLEGDFEVVSSFGHIRDLPKSKLGVDIENDFLAHYVIPKKARKTVKTLKEKASKSDLVILATDEDREGEAIAWHLLEALKISDQKYQRIVFHEITKQAILEALKNPRKININLVKAQQARRVLDRLVGYKLSPFLWRKVARGLSAGRVQSAALRLIVEREREIESFKPQKYWTIEVFFKKEEKEFKAVLIAINQKALDKFYFKNKEEVDSLLSTLKGQTFGVESVKERIISKSPPPPFQTSTLQQEAFRKLRFSSKKTMFLAQRLYEGVNLGKERRGLITYMRTDSLNIAKEAQEQAKVFIEENFSEKYSLEKGRVFKKKSKLAQEAHEAIRPTDVYLTPQKVKKYLSDDEFKLYQLIWQRFLASQMKEAKIRKVEVVLSTQKEGKNYQFKASGALIEFDGFLRIYPEKISETILPPLREGEEIKPLKIESVEHLTQPPARYNDASLVKTLESYGIGRPSTYAPIISTIQERGYVKRDRKNNFYPTEIGRLVNDILVEHFPEIVDFQFTAKMEDDLDKIAAGKSDYVSVLKNFWVPFSKNLAEKEKQLKKEDIAIEKTDLKCPLCGAPLVIRYSKYGKFLACSNFPKCPYKKSLSESEKEKSFVKTNLRCPKCKKGYIVIRKTRRGKIFYGCSRYPKCDWASWEKPEGLDEKFLKELNKK